MAELSFEWDDKKSLANKKKHGISFEEAQTVFFDEHALLIYDPDHSQKEDRFVLLGMSFRLRLLIVCHCYRKSEYIIRIISARKATHLEQKQYSERWKTWENNTISRRRKEIPMPATSSGKLRSGLMREQWNISRESRRRSEFRTKLWSITIWEIARCPAASCRCFGKRLNVVSGRKASSAE